ncbi:MAG: metal ABC transporter permease [Armatimonadota bacterium]
MIDWQSTLWVLLAGGLVATSSALVGCWLILRRMALLGDAISHAVLPGIVLAFWLTGSRAPVPMLLGAGAVGLLSTAIIQWLSQRRFVHPDAAMGVTFTALFALGVLLISRYSGQVDLDLDCVLYGEIAYVPWDLWIVGDMVLGPRAIWTLSGVLIVALLLTVGLYKELLASTFDPIYAQTAGIPMRGVYYLLMAVVALVVVASFEVVGAILVLAFLVVPPATALLIARRLPMMILMSVAFGWLAVLLGYTIARLLDVSIAGSMATASGVLFMLTLLATGLRAKLYSAGGEGVGKS